MMTWEKPTFVEINMSAEIGAYQGDEEERESESRFMMLDPNRE